MPILDSQPTALTEQARPRPTPAVLHRLARQLHSMHLFGRRGPRLPPLSPGKPFWHSAVFVASAIYFIIPYLRHLDRLLHAMPPPWFFGQAFLLAGRWSCLCEYPATAEAAFK